MTARPTARTAIALTAASIRTHPTFRTSRSPTSAATASTGAQPRRSSSPAEDGSDSNAGTQNQPLATIEAAQALVGDPESDRDHPGGPGRLQRARDDRRRVDRRRLRRRRRLEPGERQHHQDQWLTTGRPGGWRHRHDAAAPEAGRHPRLGQLGLRRACHRRLIAARSRRSRSTPVEARTGASAVRPGTPATAPMAAAAAPATAT